MFSNVCFVFCFSWVLWAQASAIEFHYIQKTADVIQTISVTHTKTIRWINSTMDKRKYMIVFHFDFRNICFHSTWMNVNFFFHLWEKLSKLHVWITWQVDLVDFLCGIWRFFKCPLPICFPKYFTLGKQFDTCSIELKPCLKFSWVSELWSKRWRHEIQYCFFTSSGEISMLATFFQRYRFSREEKPVM